MERKYNLIFLLCLKDFIFDNTKTKQKNTYKTS